MATKYRVVTKGVSAGKSITEVAGALSARFNIPADKVGAALRAPRFVLKQGLNLIDAAKYDQVLRQAGCRVVVEAEETPGRREVPQSRSARAWAKAYFQSRVGPWLQAWSAAPDRQKAVAILLATGGTVVIAVAILLVVRAPGSGRLATVPATIEHPSLPASAATPAALVGTWNCSAENSSGFTIRDTYVFQDDGRFEDRGTEVDFEGAYQNKRGTIVMTVRRARTGTTTIAPNLVIDASVAMLSASSMRLETVVRGSGQRKTATCSRIPGQSTMR